MTSEDAHQIAKDAVYAAWNIDGDEPVLIGPLSEESFGWVFGYTSKRYHETGDFKYAIAGNGPVIVNRLSGKVTMLGTAGGIKHQIEEYRKTNGA